MSKIVSSYEALFLCGLDLEISIPLWSTIEKAYEREGSGREFYLFDEIYHEEYKTWIFPLCIQRILLDIKEFLDYAAKVNEFLDFCFVLQEAPKYGIRKLSFDDPRLLGWQNPDKAWKDGAYAKIERVDGLRELYDVYFNPYIDRKEAAQYLSQMTGLRIRPEEVYYYVWFHECAHTRKVSGDLSAQSLAARRFFLGKKFNGQNVTPGSIKQLRLEAEEKADEWAIKQFRKWRSSCTL